MKKLLTLLFISALIIGILPASGFAAPKAPQPWFESLYCSVPLDFPLSPEQSIYLGTTFDATVKIEAVGADGAEVSIKSIDKSELSVNLTYGLNVIPVTATSGGSSTKITINIIRRRSADTAFADTYRPQLHYSNEMFSINDPNGLIYDATTGLYHLMFQSDYVLSDYAAAGDTKHWGHAVSRNLIDWEYVGVAIAPDENGVIWSGSGVIDKNNTSGLFDSSTPPESRMVFLYTYNGEKTHGGKGDLGYCSIGLAYSEDHGQTFEKYDKVVIPNKGDMYGAGLRDPKVVWYEDETMQNGGKWVFIACGDNKTLLFSSNDLINWSFDSYVKDNTGRRHLATECPEIIPMECDGETKWVLMASGAFYIIGDLAPDKDGKMTFTAQSAKIYPVNGVKELWGPGSSDLFPEAYAAQTFYNTADGRRLQMSWIRDFGSYADKLWYSTLSLPTELRLEKINGEYRVTLHPINELEQKRSEALLELSNKTVRSGEDILKDITGELLDITATVTPKTAQSFGFRLHKGNGKHIEIRYDKATNSVITDKTKTDPSSAFKYQTTLEKQDDGSITMRIILDKSAVEAWFDGVRHCGNAYITNSGNRCEFFCDGEVLINSLTVHRLDGMDRQSITKEKQALTQLESHLIAQLENPEKSAIEELLAKYDSLSDGERYLMSQQAHQAASKLKELLPTLTAPPQNSSLLWLAIAVVAVAAIAVAMAIITLKNSKKSAKKQ